MTDMLVKLYTLPDPHDLYRQLAEAGIDIRRGLAPEKHIVMRWAKKNFSDYWESEVDVAMSAHPVNCWLATHEGRLVGFGCYDTTLRGFFGPTGVDKTYRGKGIGKALLLACLHDMRAQGYGYAIIGGIGPADFYAASVGAVEIPDSSPSVYKGMLRAKPDDEKSKKKKKQNRMAE